MKDLRKWMANTAFDAAMPLGFIIFFEGGPLLLLFLIIFLMWRAVKKTEKIKNEKEDANETESEKTNKEAE